MLVCIYQIRDFENCDYVFRSWDCAKEIGFDVNDYKCVYSYFDRDMDSDEKMNALDDVFTKFQAGCIDFPKDFEGHSLSTSDIVALGNELYYCDSFGWEKII